MIRSAVVLSTLAALFPFQAAVGTTPSQDLDRFNSLAFRFEENRGQARPGALFVSRGSGYHLSLLAAGGSLFTITDATRKAVSLGTSLLGANPAASPEGLDPIAGLTNYLVGGDPSARRTDVPTYSRVRYRSVYPGVDLVYYGRQGRLEYDFVVAPGADSRSVRFLISGAAIRVDRGGDLVFSTPAGDVRWTKPVVYQVANGLRKPVDARFLVRGQRVGFAIASYDRTRELIIDPALNYSSYIGGRGNEASRSIALDNSGNIYITGFTTSEDLPSTGGTVQATYGGGIPTHQSTGDVFVAKLTSAGALSYITYFGGSADDVGMAIAVDAAGNAYVTGYTNSTNFRTTSGALQTTFAGQGRGSQFHEGGDAFVVKINPAGNNLVYSTFVGGSLDDRGIAIAVDSAGNAYVAGQTISTNFPTTTGAYQTNYRGGVSTEIWDGGDAFVFKLNPSGSQLIYSTYLGGSLADAASAIAVDSAGNAYVAGATTSANFPTTPGAFQTVFGGVADDNAQPIFKFGDGFVTKINPTGTALVYSTFLGGNRDDGIAALALDSSGAVYVTGATSSTNFPVSAGGAQRTYSGPNAASGYLMFGDGFVSKLNPAGSGLVYSTYFGGAADEAGWAIAVDSAGNAYVGGQSNSTDFKVSADAIQKTMGGRGGQTLAVGDGVFLKVNPAGSAFLYASYLGGASDDAIAGVVLDPAGNAYLTGTTVSGNFPTTANAAQKTFAGRSSIGLIAGDAFIAKITELTPPPPPPPAEPEVKVTAVANAASYAPDAVAAGEIIILGGSKMGPATLVKAGLTAAGFLDTTAAGVRILFDGTPAPIVYVSETQSAAIVPYNVAGKNSTQVQVEYQGVRSLPLNVRVVESIPGLFAADSSGTGPGAIFNQDATPNSASNPAATQSIVVFFGTGEGQTIPPGVDGRIATEVYPKSALSLSVTIGGSPAELLYFGAVPFQVAGLFQVNARVPAGLVPGNHDVLVTLGSGRSQQRLTVAVQ